MGTLKRFLLVVAVMLGSIAMAADGVPRITDREIADVSNTADWLAYGRNHNEQRFSPLTDIDTKSVGDLGVAWYLDLPNDVGLVATPLVLDGVLYFTGTMNVVRAVDAASGELLWEYDPRVADEIRGRKQAGMVHNRGLAIYGDKLFAATWDGRLLALSLDQGELIWSTRTFDLGEPLYITGAPKAFKGKVLIGNGGTENGAARGFVSAYDAESGDLAWRFHIVPGNPADGFENAAMEMAAETWTGQWWEQGGGGNAWHGFTYDEELDAVYIGTGNGSPWNQKMRSPGGGDNLFLCSIVALDPDTGEYRWHYQTTPGETWDYNSNMDIVLADLEIDGETVKALMHAPKNGFFYVIDRTDGRLISADAFADVNWATHVDLETGRPVEREGARYEDGREIITPSPLGAHSWHAMSYNPETGLVYIPTLHLATDFDDTTFEEETYKPVSFELNTAVGFLNGPQPRDYQGELQAWDPVAKQQVWSVPQAEPWGSGTLTTAGNLVFQGETSGWFKAYDATSGAELWSFDAGLGISAPPITYRIDGVQYVAVLVGFGGAYAARYDKGAEAHGWAYGVQKRRLIAFALGGEASVPTQPPPYFPEPIVEADFEVDEELALEGEELYLVKMCIGCHGGEAIAGGMAPDLRASAMTLSETEPVFRSIVRDGSRVSRAMPAFPDLTDRQLQALRHFIRRQAHATATSD